MKKSISILGSTGSIGINTLKILKKKNYLKLIFSLQIKTINLFVNKLLNLDQTYFSLII